MEALRLQEPHLPSLPGGSQGEVHDFETAHASRQANETKLEVAEGWASAVQALGEHLLVNPEDLETVEDVIIKDLAINYPEQIIPLFSALADYEPSDVDEDQAYAIDDITLEAEYGEDDARYPLRLLAADLIHLPVIQDDIKGTKLAIKLTKDPNAAIVEETITTLQFYTGYNKQTGKQRGEDSPFSPRAHDRLGWIAEEHFDTHPELGRATNP